MGEVTIIAEIGSTHDGSFGNAKCLIREAAVCGVDMVKFQTHLAEYETLKNAPSPSYFKDESRFDYFKRTSFSMEQYRQMKDYAEKECGVAFLSSPFSIEAVDFLDTLGLETYKIPSGEITNLLLLEHTAKTGKKVLLSSGMSTWEELETAVRTLRSHGNHDLCVMQCTSEYPCPPERIGLNVLSELRNRFGTEIGFSDHSAGFAASICAVALGATVIEKHFTLSRLMYGSDARHSLEPAEMKRFVQEIRDAQKAMSSTIDKTAVAQELSAMKAIFEKSIVYKTTLSAGTIIRIEDLSFKKPGNGISAARYTDLLGKRLKNDVTADQNVEWMHFE